MGHDFDIQDDLREADEHLLLLVQSNMLKKEEFYGKLRGDELGMGPLEKLYLENVRLEDKLDSLTIENQSLRGDLRSLSQIIMNINRHLEGQKHYQQPYNWHQIQDTLNKYGAY